MARVNRDRFKSAAIFALGLVLLMTVVAYADDPPFAGKWKGESRAAAGPGITGGPVGPGGAGAAPTGGAAAAPPAPAAGPQGGGGARGGGGGGRGGFGGFGGGVQKVTLNLKQSKDNKVSGNITIGEGSDTLDVKDGKVDGNTITFKAGRSPQPIYEYKGELKGDELILTRDNAGGRGPAPQYVLSKGKK